MKNAFIKAGDTAQRSEICRRFKTIDRNVPIATYDADGLRMAHAILVLDVPGDIVECGCYAGGSTAKLSIAAHMAERTLHVYDSFEGLPNTDETDMHTTRNTSWRWSAGEYAVGMQAVMNNVSRYGEVKSCVFHAGWFDETLPDMLPQEVALAFTDVDLPSSVRTCLAAIWPRLVRGGAYFTHDAAFINALYTMYDPLLWQEIDDDPPPLIGAGHGIGGASPHLGMMVKYAPDAEYVAKLLLRR